MNPNEFHEVTNLGLQQKVNGIIYGIGLLVLIAVVLYLIFT